jgi:hypothetical protein
VETSNYTFLKSLYENTDELFKEAESKLRILRKSSVKTTRIRSIAIEGGFCVFFNGVNGEYNTALVTDE